MKLTKKDFDYCKSITDNNSIEHLKSKIYFKAGTVGITFMKRTKFDFIDIATVNHFRDKTLTEINNYLESL
jgi:hypothetical protein